MRNGCNLGGGLIWIMGEMLLILKIKKIEKLKDVYEIQNLILKIVTYV